MDAIDTWCATYPDSPVVLDVLGTSDPEAIRARAFELEPETEEVFFFGASVGATFGVRLRDGARRAIKVNTLFGDPGYYAAVQRVQAELRTEGFPAPRPIRLVGQTTVDEWLDEGVFRDAHEPDVRRAMVVALVRLVHLATATRIRPRREFLRPEGALWPRPHNALFDFEATSAGAEWIDAIGRRAAAVARAGREVVGHTDWAAKHLRFDDDLCPTAVYDWDSIQTDTEPVIAGTAAGSFTYTEELEEPVARWPSPDESLSFLAEYERARGTPFSEDERRSARAACVYLLAYASRCHHAVGGDPARAMRLQEFADLLL